MNKDGTIIVKLLQANDLKHIKKIFLNCNADKATLT